MGSYIPSTQEERGEMLKKIGLSSIDELHCAVAREIAVKELKIPHGMSELEVMARMEELAAKNRVFKYTFRGAGAYNHYIPAIVKSVVSKEEFLTAYTPYQAEISQGILQSIFEYQTEICELTGMAVSNASVYDGASAAGEAVAMCTDKKRKRALISASSNPMVIETVRTYCFGSGTQLEIIAEKDGRTDMEALKAALTDDVACVVTQQPNYFGMVEDCEKIAALAHEKGAKYVCHVNPISLGLLKTPFECGADVAVGEGQPLGMPLAFGGPYLGFMAATQAMMRRLPGRIVGETEDKNAERSFVLTLQAREQHIRREKASSNICSNQALCALTAAVYMAAMGEDGMRQVAQLNISKAHYAAAELCKIDGVELKYKGEFFNEFVTRCPKDASLIANELEKYDILAGLPMEGRDILWCVTEMNTKEQIDMLCASLKEVCAK
ncbi:MAG: aminomethyl-transferring glycine dehydrogenase subunit GcvPA [Oscillospiraceae bacterium]